MSLKVGDFINVNFCVWRDFMFDSFVSDMQKLLVEIDFKGGGGDLTISPCPKEFRANPAQLKLEC